MGIDINHSEHIIEPLSPRWIFVDLIYLGDKSSIMTDVCSQHQVSIKAVNGPRVSWSSEKRFREIPVIGCIFHQHEKSLAVWKLSGADCTTYIRYMHGITPKKIHHEHYQPAKVTSNSFDRTKRDYDQHLDHNQKEHPIQLILIRMQRTLLRLST